jgi:tRNA A-37 threonylcarbamoyl transferase component Bud32
MAEQCPDENELLDLVMGKRASPGVAAHVATCPTCSLAISFDAPEAPVLVEGATLGRYRIVREIGRGAAGTVYEAKDDLLDRTVAIKVLRRASTDARERLLREARLIAKLDHENVVAIHDAGEADGTLYFAMELVRGPSLRELVATKPPRRELFRALCDAGRGLAAAHGAGVVHRDFKPANVLVASTGRVVVVDFGLAATVEDRATEIAGTPAYMPPEQIDGRATDARSDQFAFCASLVHVMSGALPFGPAATLGELRDAISRERLDPAALAALPAHVRRVVQRGLRADPAERWPSMDAVLARLAGRSRMIAGVALGAIALAAGGVIAGRVLDADEAPPHACTLAAARIDGVLGRGKHPELAAWAARWRTDREATCRVAATGTDSRADREGLCLDGQLVQLGATIDIGAPPRAIAMLPSPAQCHGKRLPALASESRAVRAEKLRASLALLDTLHGVRVTMLAGTPHALSRVTLPHTVPVEIARVAYDGDLWELRVAGGAMFAFDRKNDLLVTIAPEGTTTTQKTWVDVHHNGRGFVIAPDGRSVVIVQGRELAALDGDGKPTRWSSLDPAYQFETMAFCPGGVLYAAASKGTGNAAGRILVTIETLQGTVEERGPIGDAAGDPIDIDVLACDREGRLFGVDTIDMATNELYAIDPRTGARTLVAVLPGPINGLVVE